MLPSVSLTSHSRRQQLTPSPLSPPCLSLSHTQAHTHGRSHWQGSLLSVFPLTIPPSLLPTDETRSDYPPLFSRQTHQQIYRRPLGSLCWSLWKRLNVVLNCTFFSIQPPFIKNPTQNPSSRAGLCCKFNWEQIRRLATTWVHLFILKWVTCLGCGTADYRGCNGLAAKS